MAIHGAHNIEDSTLEDFAELLQFEEANAPAVEKILKSDSLKKEEEEEKPKDLSDREMVLEAYDRMSKSLKTGLMGIRTAKKGIEQLEDQVSHTENIAIFQESKPDETECPHCIAKPATENVAYIHVPVPRLYHRRPQFRLTILGWILFLLAAWYYTENRLWEEYGFTEVCTRRACNLNLDSPYFGQVIPWKLDDWIFGGRVRALYREYEEPLSDWYLDVWETVLFVDIRDISPRVMHPVDREQWRRRMIKKGYIKEPEWVPPTAELAAKLARGRAMLEASERKEAGDDVGGRDDGDGSDDIGSGDETMAADEPVFEESPKKSGWF
ncbi:hypothetical protein NKR23_g726 [Pleurostoma richardsiae]|uniref:Uncharacterized protein n=1 Tax=Pleurostoma richardsiae TaxID=41990 RepID=A0AA38VQQ1_9PEZI|nr:hypothetical protein NKR23_g726 [Pleurostoma richardsiae]